MIAVLSTWMAFKHNAEVSTEDNANLEEERVFNKKMFSSMMTDLWFYGPYQNTILPDVSLIIGVHDMYWVNHFMSCNGHS